MKRIVITLLLLIVALSGSAGLALAGPLYDRIIQTDQTVQDNVTVVSDDLRVESGAVIDGSATVIRGDVLLAGTITGDLVVVNGDIRFDTGGQIGGACVVIGGRAIPADGLATKCRVSQGLAGLGSAASVWRGLGSEVTGRVTGFGRIVAQILIALGSGLVMGLIALFVGAVIPRHLLQISAAIHEKPFATGAVGFLTGLALPSLIVLVTILSIPLILLFCVGLLGFPIALALSALFVGGLIMGWVAVGNLVGEWLTRALRLSHLSLPATAALGTIIITLILNLLPLLPLGRSSASLGSLLVLSLGLGAVALTKFGVKPYPLYLPRPGKVSPLENDPVVKTLSQ